MNFSWMGDCCAVLHSNRGSWFAGHLFARNFFESHTRMCCRVGWKQVRVIFAKQLKALQCFLLSFCLSCPCHTRLHFTLPLTGLSGHTIFSCCFRHVYGIPTFGKNMSKTSRYNANCITVQFGRLKNATTSMGGNSILACDWWCVCLCDSAQHERMTSWQ